ncbi:MAG: AI-2E family transporter [Eubacterium sp.]|nr:AI-2E family transporter [Eubacterium sp.]
MKKGFLDKLDQRYLKICAYASATVIITVVLLYLLSNTGGFWTTLWTLFTAILKPVIIGGIICYLFLPIVNKIESKLEPDNKTRNRRIAVAVFYGGVALVLGGLVLVLYLALRGGMEGLENLNIETIRAFIESLYAQFEDILNSLNADISQSDLPLDQASEFLTSVVNGVASFFSGLLFGIIFSIYFMLDETNIRKYWSRVIHLFVGERSRTAVRQFSKDADMVFSGYIRGQFTDALLVGVITCIVFVIAGIPYAPVIGVIVGVGNLIPYVGPIFGYISIAIICIVTGQYDKLVLGIILMAVIMFIDGNVINPKLLSHSVKVHPLLVVASLIAGGAIGGFLGMIVAVPTGALIKLYFDRLMERREKKLAVRKAKAKESEEK